MGITDLVRRTGQFAEKDPLRCKHYAGWIEHIRRREADLIFWCLFGVVILLLVIASSAFNRYVKSSAPCNPILNLLKWFRTYNTLSQLLILLQVLHKHWLHLIQTLRRLMDVVSHE